MLFDHFADVGKMIKFRSVITIGFKIMPLMGEKNFCYTLIDIGGIVLKFIELEWEINGWSGQKLN